MRQLPASGFLLLIVTCLVLSGCAGTGTAPTTTPPDNPPADVIPPPSGATNTSVISTDGGTQTIGGVVTVVWPKGAFASPTTVTVSATATNATDQDFNSSAFLFRPSGKRLYEIRINTGGVAPAALAHTTLTVPQTFLAVVPPGYGIQAFIQFLEEGGDDSIDSFEMVDSVVNLPSSTVDVEVPPSAFTTSRTGDSTFEAITTLAPTPGTNPTRSRSQKRSLLLLPGDTPDSQCQAKSIGSPLAGVDPLQLQVTDPFNPPSHYGVDLAARDGDGVVAVSDGVISAVDYQVSSTRKNRFGQPSGWGYYLVLTAGDGSAILYAHLQKGSTDNLKVPMSVNQGDLIGATDSSGGVTGPHLHLEYAPGGNIYAKANKIDPLPCIGSTVAGSIAVGDNGNVADDAFAVSVDGLDFGTTTIGGTNNIAVNNMRPGDHTLTIVCVVAPDDDGTLGISLSNGWTFSDGTTSLSADLSLNQTVDYTFVVPPASLKQKYNFIAFPRSERPEGRR